MNCVISTFNMFYLMFQRVTFQSAMFHPQVDMKTGEMNLKREFPEWRKGFHHLWQVLEFMRTAFYMLDIKDPANEESTEM